MKKIKSNPYVYSYTPFLNLSNKKHLLKKSGVKKISINDLRHYLNFHTLPTIIPKKGEASEKILNIFLSNQIRFGPKKYITSLQDYWLKKINYFITNNLPLNFVILGFPFKIPVLLKTDRSFPDMGEVLSLKRLYDLCCLIEKIYSPGAKINIITEEVFGHFNNMSKEELKNYQKFLRFLVKKLDWDKKLFFTPLDEMENFTNNFEEKFQSKINELEQKFIKNDKKFMKKYNGAYNSLYHITNTKRLNLPLNYLMDIYREKTFKKIVVERTKKLLGYYTHLMLIKYLAYLELRDDINFIEKNFPDSLMLSVSPKPYRLGIHPVDKKIIRLPYHGVTVFDEKNKKFSIEYLIDLKRQKWVVEEVFLEEDRENKPFFYIKK